MRRILLFLFLLRRIKNNLTHKTMKKYRIIQEYPNCSLKEGDIITFTEGNDYNNESEEILIYDVDKFPDFFAPINADRYQFDYSTPDRIGSVHWFNTLMGFAHHVAEFMMAHPEHELNKGYAESLKQVTSDIIRGQQDGFIKLRG